MNGVEKEWDCYLKRFEAHASKVIRVTAHSEQEAHEKAKVFFQLNWQGNEDAWFLYSRVEGLPNVKEVEPKKERLLWDQ